jgi:hypothetical protein
LASSIGGLTPSRQALSIRQAQDFIEFQEALSQLAGALKIEITDRYAVTRGVGGLTHT